jgi:NCAIR mutase (PurE)-related protein
VNRDALLKLLEQVAAGDVDTAAAAERLKSLPFDDLGFARVDLHRAHRSGASEVIYGAGKQPDHIAAIARSLLDHDHNVLVTRASAAAFDAVHQIAEDAIFDEVARCITVVRHQPEATGRITVVCAGTSDLPVAREAVVSARFFGAEVDELSDVGVAGLHRLLPEIERLRAADVVIVCAGMDGALPSVVGGVLAGPVIAVPTSVGYGAAFGGVSALLANLNACAAGVLVVNIDNGFGAARAAHRILHRRAAAERA